MQAYARGHRQEVDAALASFWLEQAAHAPEQRVLMQHVEEEDVYVSDLRDDADA